MLWTWKLGLVTAKYWELERDTDEVTKAPGPERERQLLCHMIALEGTVRALYEPDWRARMRPRDKE